MILLLILAVTAVTATGQQPFEVALRKSRQLDFDSQDKNLNDKSSKNNSHSSTLETLINDYLPPVTDFLLKKESAAQSQVNVDFKSANALVHELCKSSESSILCGLKESLSKSESKVTKPSRDLVPPLNDIEHKTNFKNEVKNFEYEKTTAIPLNTDFSVFSAISHSTFVTTTRPVSRTTSKPVQQKKENTKPAIALPVSKTVEATNELRSYLPPQPEYSAAAQTSVGVVQPLQQNNEHDHHHHHHDDHHGHHHGDICADAFHSFLCAPLKARKRITGALPNSITRAQGSSVQYQKLLPNADKETAPSNTFQNEYLPPPPQPSPSSSFISTTKFIQPTYTPPRTTQRIITTTTTTPPTYTPPKVVPEPSNSNDRFYLPPLPNNNLFSPKLPPPTKQVFTVQTLSTPVIPLVSANSNNINSFRSNLVSPTTATPKANTVVTNKPVVAQANSFFLNKYLQPSPINVVVPIAPLFGSSSTTQDRSYLPPKPSLVPAASFVSTAKNFYPTTTISPVPSRLPTTVISTFVPISSNSIFLSPIPKFQPQPTIVSTTEKLLTAQPSSTNVFTTPKPTFRPSTFIPQPSKIEDSYLPPEPKLQFPSNIVTTTFKPFTTTTEKPITTTAKLIPQPSALDRSYLPAEPNFQPAAAQINAEAIAAPQTKNPFHHGRDLCTDPFHSFLCVGPKPRKRITGALPSGFRPDSSNRNELRLKPATTFQNEKIQKPDKPLVTSSSQTVGYNYPKSINPLPAPANIISSTAPPSFGYSYPKAEKEFPLPSRQNEVKVQPTKRPTTTTSTSKSILPPLILQTSEARTITGYDYPKPEKEFPAFSTRSSTVITTLKPSSTGYNYQKPQKPFPLPTEPKVYVATTKNSATSSTVNLAASSTNERKGYEYPKPQQSFDLPEKKGYSYPKPEKRLELPTENRAETLLSQKSPDTSPLGDLASAEFIPVNKLDKREESPKALASYRRFGERLRYRMKNHS